MGLYVEKGPKRRRVYFAETMSPGERAFEVFIRWYLDERLHQAITDDFQHLELMKAKFVEEKSNYSKSPKIWWKAYKEKYEKGETIFDPRTKDGWSPVRRKTAKALTSNIRKMVKVLGEKEWPSTKRPAIEMENGFPKPTERDAFGLVAQLLHEYV